MKHDEISTCATKSSMLKNIIILGSCVSRDIFKGDFYNGKDNIFIDRYFARTSLISLFSSPAEIEFADSVPLNPFEIRLIKDDLYKHFVEYFPKKTGQYLLIDFIDERFNILKTNGDRFFTISNEFTRAHLQEIMPGVVLDRNKPETMALWKEACLLFIQKIKDYFPPENIILHKAFYTYKYKENGTVKSFTWTDTIRKQNKLLVKYYDFFEENYPGIRLLDLSNGRFIADANHIWGLSATHYQEEYYTGCYDYIRNIGNDVVSTSSDLQPARKGIN